MRSKLSDKTYILLSLASISLAIFAFTYPYAEQIGMNFLSSTEHPVIVILLGVASIASLIFVFAFGIWFVVELVKDVINSYIRHKPKTPDIPRIDPSILVDMSSAQREDFIRSYGKVLKALSKTKHRSRR